MNNDPNLSLLFGSFLIVGLLFMFRWFRVRPPASGAPSRVLAPDDGPPRGEEDSPVLVSGNMDDGEDVEDRHFPWSDV